MPNAVTSHRYQSRKTWKETVRDIQEVFEAWDVPSTEWGVRDLGGGAEVWYYLPFDPDRKAIISLGQSSRDDDLRVCWDGIVALQRLAKRGAYIMSGNSQLLALPPGNATGSPSPSANGQAGPSGMARRSRYKGFREACQALGIREDAEYDDAKAMWRLKASRFHPDNAETKDEEKFKAVNDAWEMVRARRGWEG